MVLCLYKDEYQSICFRDDFHWQLAKLMDQSLFCGISFNLPSQFSSQCRQYINNSPLPLSPVKFIFALLPMMVCVCVCTIFTIIKCINIRNNNWNEHKAEWSHDNFSPELFDRAIAGLTAGENVITLRIRYECDTRDDTIQRYRGYISRSRSICVWMLVFIAVLGSI